MKDKSLADEWFQNYMYATRELIKVNSRKSWIALMCKLSRSSKKKRLYLGLFLIDQNTAKGLRELQLIAAKQYEYYSEHQLPKVTRKSLGLN